MERVSVEETVMDDGEYTVTIHNDRESWLASRDVIGASEVAAALGLSPYDSRYSLWSRKVGLSSATLETRAMRRGVVMEPFVASEYAMETGRKLIDLGRWTLCRSKRWPHLSCTPDRLIEAIDDRGVGGLEIKAVTNRRAWSDGIVPEHYRVQCVASMAVLGLRWFVLAGYVMGTDEIIPIEIERNEDHVQALVEATGEFMEMVRDGRAALAAGQQPMRFPDPDASEATMHALRERWAQETARDDVPVIDTEESNRLEVDWSFAAKDAASAAKKVDACKVRAMTLMRDTPEIKLPGGTRLVWKTERSGSRVLRRYAAK